MARLHNVAPSFLLVFIGAICAAHSWTVFTMPVVWAMATASAGIAVSSVVVNDYFDYVQGVDKVNAPDKPLPSLSSPLLRLSIALGTVATLLYTPLLKRLTGVKNLTVAFVIAASPFCGAMATGKGVAALQSILPLTGYLFGLVCYREILMDINDRKGDGEAGIQTVPVVFGSMRALAIATGCCLAGAFAGVKGLAAAKVIPSIARSLNVQHSIVRTALQLLLVLGLLPALFDVVRMRSSQLDAGDVDHAVGNSFKPLACGLMLLSVV